MPDEIEPRHMAEADKIIRTARLMVRLFKATPWDLFGIALAAFFWAAAVWNWIHR